MSNDEVDPLVSIGVPVYNGERFLRQALESLVAQDFDDFEVIISDNASTDGTEAIAREFVRRDDRVTYVRQPKNFGAAHNFNEVFRLSRGSYFKWAAADDLVDRQYLSRCLALLQQEDDAVLCHSLTVDIDDLGRVVRDWRHQSTGKGDSPHVRLRELLTHRHECFPVFGLMRRNALERTGLIGSYTESDDVLVAELALHGRFAEVPDPLFLHREHVGRSVTAHPRSRDRAEWFDTGNAGKIVFPAWRLSLEYFKAIHRAPLPFFERVRCYAQMRRWVDLNWRSLLRNVAWAIRERMHFLKALSEAA